jgi:hypothetical protein
LLLVTEILHFQGHGQTLGALQDGGEERENPGRKGLQAEEETGVAKTYAPGLEGLAKNLALFQEDGEKLKSQVEKKDEVRYRQAEMPSRRYCPPETAGKLKGRCGRNQVGRKEDDGGQPEENDGREDQALVGNPAPGEGEGPAGSKKYLQKGGKEQEKSEGTESSPGRCGSGTGEAVQDCQAQIDKEDLRPGMAGQRQE